MELGVFIVEDELAIRERICAAIDWKSYGFYLVGSASDGEQALHSIKKEKPDIVLSDIKMPFMTGIELVKQVKQFNSNTEFILFSGYQDFEYARKALELGVSNYLLKPVKTNDLLLALWKIREQIEEKRENQEQSRNLQSLKQNNFILMLINGDIVTTSEILNKAEECDISILSNFYNISLISVKDKENREELMFVKNTLFEEHDKDLSTFILNDTTLLILHKSEKLLEIKSKIEDLKNKLHRIKREYDTLSFTYKIGDIVDRLSKIYLSYRSCFEQDTIKTQSELNLNTQEYELINLDHLRNKIAAHDFTGIIDNIEDLVPIQEEGFKSLIYRSYYVNYILNQIVEVLEEQNCIVPDILAKENWENIILQFPTLQKFYHFLIKVFENVKRKHVSISENDSIHLKNAKEIVDKEFMNSNLNLRDVADRIYISLGYLSSLFNNQMDISFSDYLNNRRINEAKKLLLLSNHKIQEIAKLTGYTNATYFSLIFKKIVGISPREYREKK